MLCRIGENMPLTEAERLDFRRQASPRQATVVGQAILRRYVRPAVEGIGIARHFGWHTFRHTYSTLLRSVGTEFKVMQELLRHATLRSTLDIYTQAVTPANVRRRLPCSR